MQKILANRQTFSRGLSVYIHWPFCKSICPYCDFNRYKRDSIDHTSMTNTYNTIFSQFTTMINSEQLWPYTHIESVFFGGGTPSTANPQLFHNVISRVQELNECLLLKHSNIQKRNEIEVTMEANPTSIEVDKLKEFRDAGVNRVSIGVQSLDPKDLTFLGRQHSVSDALRAIQVAQSLFNNRVSIDLMFGTEQHAKDNKVWEHVLSDALKLGTNHISLYQLTVEKHTQFYKRWKKGEFALPDEEASDVLYNHTINKCEENGLNQYEISNFARDGYECKHNMQYWRSGDYLGIGPGAHSRLTTRNNKRYSMVQVMKPEDWIHSVCSTNLKPINPQLEIDLLGNIKTEMLTPEQRIEELFMMGLRLPREGVREDQLSFHNEKENVRFEDVLNRNVLTQLERNNFITMINQNGINRSLVCTRKGAQVLDELLSTLLH